MIMRKGIMMFAGGFLAAVLLAGPGKADPGSDVNTKIERIYELLYPLQGAKAPAPGLPPSYTANRVEAFRILRTLPEQNQEELRTLFLPAIPLDCLESTTYPLRSCYNTEAEIPAAQAVLSYAEAAWAMEVDDFGFWAPTTIDPAGVISPGMNFYLGDTRSIGASGYTSPEEENTSTPHADCVAYIVIDEQMRVDDVAYWKEVVGHEFNHGCQMAMDCFETITSMEGTATWVMPYMFPGDYTYFYASAQEYQFDPGYSLGWGDYNSSYPYGACIFVKFVEEFAGGRDPSSIAGIWEGSVQEGWGNEPDLLDAALDLASEGGVGEAEFYSAFGEWRYFVGENDDGRHFEHGSEWPGTQVTVEGWQSISSVERFPVNISGDIMPLGYYYEQLSLNGDTLPPGRFTVSLAGSSTSRWALELWTVTDGLLVDKSTAMSDESGAALLTAELEDLVAEDEVYLLFINMGAAEVDWDDSFRDQHFSVRLDYLIYPTLRTVTPASLYLGQSAELTVTGSWLQDGLEITIPGEGVEIVDVDMESEESVVLTVQVAMDAPTGPRDIVVDNYPGTEGFTATLEDAVSVVQPAPPGVTGLSPESGEPGEQLVVRVDGNHFLPEDEVSFGCPEVTIIRTDYYDEHTIYLHVDIDANADEKLCDVTVTDAWDVSSTLNDGFAIAVDEGPDADAEAEGDGGMEIKGGSCGCAMVL
jgi:hypothetical protein